jgi:hypothetical protein
MARKFMQQTCERLRSRGSFWTFHVDEGQDKENNHQKTPPKKLKKISPLVINKCFS